MEFLSWICDGGIVYDARQIITYVLLILMTLLSIAMVVVVMMQDSPSGSIGAITGSSDTFYGKNKAKSKEVMLKRLTLILEQRFWWFRLCSLW